MQLTRFTDLGLRVLMMLASAEAGARMTTGELAQALDASETHLAKIVSRLVTLDVVESRRGRSGGLSLTAAGRTRTVGSVVRELEGAGVVDCSTCPLRGSCRLKNLLDRAEQAFLAVLDEATLGELVDSPTGPFLLTLLSAPRGSASADDPSTFHRTAQTRRTTAAGASPVTEQENP